MKKNTLETWRLKKGLSQKEVAQSCKISLRQYSNIENGKSIPLVTTANRICNTLDITPLQVLEWVIPSLLILEFSLNYHHIYF